MGNENTKKIIDFKEIAQRSRPSDIDSQKSLGDLNKNFSNIALFEWLIEAEQITEEVGRKIIEELKAEGNK